MLLINMLFLMLINTLFHPLINTKKLKNSNNLSMIYIFFVLINA